MYDWMVSAYKGYRSESLRNLLEAAFRQANMDRTVFEVGWNGVCDHELLWSVVDKLVADGWDLHSHVSFGEDSRSAIFVCQDALLHAHHDGSWGQLELVSTDQLTCIHLRHACEVLPTSDRRAGKVMILASTAAGVVTRELGKIGESLERHNYDPDTIEKFDRLVGDFGSPSPSGRLLLLDGVPGTGKTYFVRGLIEAVDAVWLYLPVAMISNLAAPDLAGVLLDERTHRAKDLPIILVLEDADDCLVSRQTDNISMISSILNLTDGIVGELLDIRVVATTNVNVKDVDKALMRPGRLWGRISFDKLKPELADSISRRLGGPAFPDTHAGHWPTLAEVYATARGWEDERAEE